jgi:putative acetyltransferase
LKRVFVLEAQRGRGHSKAIVAHLEEHLRRRAVPLVRLETGIHQPEALGLYRRLGYRERGPFGSYGPDPYSVFMEKRLDAA